MMEALSSLETSVLTRATRRNIPEDGIRLFNFVPPMLWVYHSSYTQSIIYI
jgi:hypothetical protein